MVCGSCSSVREGVNMTRMKIAALLAALTAGLGGGTAAVTHEASSWNEDDSIVLASSWNEDGYVPDEMPAWGS
jgi:hypothetical protein